MASRVARRNRSRRLLRRLGSRMRHYGDDLTIAVHRLTGRAILRMVWLESPTSSSRVPAGRASLPRTYSRCARRSPEIVLVDPRDPLSLTGSKVTEAYRNYWPGPDDTMARFMDRSIDLLEELDRDSCQAFELNRRGYVFLTADVAEAERLSTFAEATVDRHAHAGPMSELVGEPPHDSAALSLHHRPGDGYASRPTCWVHERLEAGAAPVGALMRARTRGDPR